MKNLLYILSALIASLLFNACEEVDNSEYDLHSLHAPDYAASLLPVVRVDGDIVSDVTWNKNSVWEINGIVTVRNGATLTIEPGTFIKSTINSPGDPNGVLVIAKDGKINAVGTAGDPIVFTSRYMLDGDPVTVGSPGDFGGLVMLGNAVTNYPGGTKLAEGLPDDPRFYYGGPDDSDNRGMLQYIRIEYAGYDKEVDDEVNGLTLAGVGAGTTVDHIQVSFGLDDSFEFFGGTVNASYLVSLAAQDDPFDFDNGYTGRIQYALALADKNSHHETFGNTSLPDSHGIEADNLLADPAAVPVTHPVLVHFGIIGVENMQGVSSPGFGQGISLRNGAGIQLDSSIVTGYPGGIVFDAKSNAGLSLLNDVSVHGFTSAISKETGRYRGRRNTFLTNPTALPFGMPQPWYNAPGSPLTLLFAGAGTVGAFPESNAHWADGWTKFVF